MVKSCVYCRSTDIIRHGQTSLGVQRYRCFTCGKTWSSKTNYHNIKNLPKMAHDYLNGKTIRELSKQYHSTPTRINTIIRDYLKRAPDWHEFVDLSVNNHTPRQIYLSGKKFHCSWNRSDCNEMYIAFAIDSLTGFVLAYKVCFDETVDIWMELLNNLKERSIVSNSFLTNGSEKSIVSVKSIYPASDLKINYHKNYRDRELGCCLSRVSPSQKLINDASRVYFTMKNNKIANKLGIKDESELRDFLCKREILFLDIVKKRLQNRTKIFNDNLPNLFQKRFEKFHLLKEDPQPLVNSWVANQMLLKDENGISRLTLYTQDYSKLDFNSYVRHRFSINTINKHSSKLLEQLLLEVTARSLELPLFSNECHFDFGKCALVV